MKKMYSAVEIAEMRIPNLPKTATNIRQRADREGWAFARRNRFRRRAPLVRDTRTLLGHGGARLPLDLALQAALSAHKAANAMAASVMNSF